MLRPLEHENVIQFFDYILVNIPQAGNFVYIVTEYFQVQLKIVFFDKLYEKINFILI